MIGSRSNVARRLEDFQKKALIGKGTFGKVFLAELAGDTSGKQYAIKAIANGDGGRFHWQPFDNRDLRR